MYSLDPPSSGPYPEEDSWGLRLFLVYLLSPEFLPEALFNLVNNDILETLPYYSQEKSKFF